MSHLNRLRFESLEKRELLAADFKITEFMASNDATIFDEDGDDADWIEVANLGDSSGDLAGWYLTDDHDELDQWQFPSVNLEPQQRLIIWASKKNRSVSGSELHTNFKLSAGGEYLGLIASDGSTVASEFAPEYPQQFPDISFGVSEFGPLEGQFRYFGEPSPGQSNLESSKDTSPFLNELGTDSDGSPDDAADIIVTVEVIAQGEAVSAVHLQYVVMFGSETSIEMFDDGAHGDSDAGDGVFGATIPNEVASLGEMVRYYVSAETELGATSRLPRFASTDSQEYGGVVIADPTVTSELPIYQWFVENPRWFVNSNGSNNKNPTSTSLFYDGEFYDNVSVKVKGNSSAQYPAPKFKFTLPSDKSFQFAEGKEPADKFDLQSGYQDPSFARTTLGFNVFAEAGSYAPDSFYVHTRMNGEFYRLGIYIERIDNEFLANHGLGGDDALYKADGLRDRDGFLLPAADLGSTAGFEKKNRDDIDPTFDDLKALIAGVSPSNPNRSDYLLDNVNIPEVISTLAIYAITKHYDSTSQNYYLHRDSDGNGLWNLIPWDMDLIWGRLKEPVYNRYFSGHPFTGSSSIPTWTSKHWNRLYDAIFDVPVTQEMYLRRLRTLMDEILQPPSTPQSERVLEGRVAELATMIEPEALADYAIWGQKEGSVWGHVGPLPQGVQHINSKFDVRRNYLYNLSLIPDAQPAEFPVEFGVIESFPLSRNQREEFIEIINPNSFAIDISDWTLSVAVEHRFAKGTVIPAGSTLYVTRDENAFRARTTGPTGGQGLLIQGDYDGGLSTDGETLDLHNALGQLVTTIDFPAFDIPPTIEAISDQTITQGESTVAITIQADDEDTDPVDLVYSATANSLAYRLSQQLNVTVPLSTTGASTFYQNHRGSGEKYLTNLDGSVADRWYYLLPSGDLYRFTGNVASTSNASLQGDFIASLGVEVYNDPTRLTNAVPLSNVATFDFSGTNLNRLVVTSNPLFFGSLAVTVSVSDGQSTRSTDFFIRVQEKQTAPPVLASIENQSASSGSTLTVPIFVTDPDTPLDQLTFFATSESLLQRLSAELNLQAPASPNYYTNYRGSGEKYLTNPSGSAADRWYYLLPAGGLYRFTGNVTSSSPSSLTGIFIADVGVGVYNDPSRLTDAAPSSSDATFVFSETTPKKLFVTTDPAFAGTLSVTVSVFDGKDTGTTTFSILVQQEPTEPPTAEPPALSPIADQITSGGVTITIPVQATDPDTPLNELIFSATTESLLQRLDSELKLQAPVSPNYYLNYRGSGEKYLANPSGSAANRWYYLLPAGGLYRFTGNVASSSPSSLTGQFIADVGGDVYADPSLLHSPTTSPVFSTQFTGTPVDSLQIVIPSDFVGDAQLMVSVSDGTSSDTQSFRLYVQPNTNAAPSLAEISDQTLAPGASLELLLNAVDTDTPGDDLFFDASATSLAGHLNETLNLTKPNSGSFPDYYTNYRGAQEKYLLNPSGVSPHRWYYLLPNGNLYRFTGNAASSSPSSLQGVLLYHVGTAIYTDPTLLHEATTSDAGVTLDVVGPPSPGLSISASQSFNSPVIVSVIVSDGEQSDTKSFLISPAQSEALAETAEAEWQLQAAPVSLAAFADPEISAAIPAAAYEQTSINDVNSDGLITPLDALLVINFIDRTPEMERAGSIIDSILDGGPVYDTSGDGNATPIDALRVINHLALQATASEGESTWRDGVDSALADFPAALALGKVANSSQDDDETELNESVLF